MPSSAAITCTMRFEAWSMASFDEVASPVVVTSTSAVSGLTFTLDWPPKRRYWASAPGSFETLLAANAVPEALDPAGRSTMAPAMIAAAASTAMAVPWSFMGEAPPRDLIRGLDAGRGASVPGSRNDPHERVDEAVDVVPLGL